MMKHENVYLNYGSSRVQGQANSPRLGITLQARRSLFYERLLFELYAAINNSSMSHSPSRMISALRAIPLRALPGV